MRPDTRVGMPIFVNGFSGTSCWDVRAHAMPEGLYSNHLPDSLFDSTGVEPLRKELKMSKSFTSHRSSGGGFAKLAISYFQRFSSLRSSLFYNFQTSGAHFDIFSAIFEPAELTFEQFSSLRSSF